MIGTGRRGAFPKFLWPLLFTKAEQKDFYGDVAHIQSVSRFNVICAHCRSTTLLQMIKDRRAEIAGFAPLTAISLQSISFNQCTHAS